MMAIASQPTRSRYFPLGIESLGVRGVGGGQRSIFPIIKRKVSRFEDTLSLINMSSMRSIVVIGKSPVNHGDPGQFRISELEEAQEGVSCLLDPRILLLLLLLLRNWLKFLIMYSVSSKP